MDVVPTGDGTYTAPTFPDPPIGTFVDMSWHAERRNVVEGGQLLGAAIVAAAKARPDQRVTSAHIAFLKAASFDEPIEVSVDPLRRVDAVDLDVKIEQAGALRGALVMTDAGADDLFRHAEPMPGVPAVRARCDFGVLGRDIRVVGGALARAGAIGHPSYTCGPGSPRRRTRRRSIRRGPGHDPLLDQRRCDRTAASPRARTGRSRPAR
jgi:hypothetical protein